MGGHESLDRVLTEADVVVLSCPLNNETRGLSVRELGLMKHSAFLINVARGPVVDEQALWNALRDQQIAGAGIDTWYCYPETGDEVCLPSRFPFQELENVIMTPHIGGWSIRTRERRLRLIADNIDRIARNDTPLNIVGSLWDEAMLFSAKISCARHKRQIPMRFRTGDRRQRSHHPAPLLSCSH